MVLPELESTNKGFEDMPPANDHQTQVYLDQPLTVESLIVECTPFGNNLVDTHKLLYHCEKGKEELWRQ